MPICAPGHWLTAASTARSTAWSRTSPTLAGLSPRNFGPTHMLEKLFDVVVEVDGGDSCSGLARLQASERDRLGVDASAE